MNELFVSVYRDFKSCNCPTIHDPKTIGALGRIAEAINAGEMSRSEFDRFADEHLGKGYFNKDCKIFMDWVTEYLACRYL